MSFDSLGFAQELEKVDFPAKQSKAIASLIRDQVVGTSARKDDLIAVEARLSEKIDYIEERLSERIGRGEERMEAKLSQLELRMTIKLGSMLVVAIGIVVAAQKLW